MSRHFTPEHRKKISDAHLGRPSPHLGIKHTEEAKMRMSISHLGSHHTEEAKAKNSKAHLGIRLSVEHRNKIAKGLLGKHRDDKTKGKICKAMLGKHHSDEAKEKMREARLKHVIPLKNTTIELAIQEALARENIPFLTHVHLFGQPDIQLLDSRILIFVDGCYWHSCQKCGFVRYDKRYVRDLLVTRKLILDGWIVIRLWEHDIKNKEKLDAIILAIKDASAGKIIDGMVDAQYYLLCNVDRI